MVLCSRRGGHVLRSCTDIRSCSSFWSVCALSCWCALLWATAVHCDRRFVRSKSVWVVCVSLENCVVCCVGVLAVSVNALECSCVVLRVVVLPPSVGHNYASEESKPEKPSTWLWPARYWQWRCMWLYNVTWNLGMMNMSGTVGDQRYAKNDAL